MLPHTTYAVSAFPEVDVGRPTQFASKTGVGTIGLFLCYNVGVITISGAPRAIGASPAEERLRPRPPIQEYSGQHIHTQNLRLKKFPMLTFF